MRNRYLAVCVGVFFMALSGPSIAGGINPFPSDVDGLTKGESDALKEAIGKALGIYKSGSTVEWTSTDSKRAGRVKIEKIFDRDGKHCATVENKFTKGVGNSYTLPFCQVADGSWKVSF